MWFLQERVEESNDRFCTGGQEWVVVCDFFLFKGITFTTWRTSVEREGESFNSLHDVTLD